MGFDISFGAAFLAGLLSFLTPCVLPIVPLYIGYLAGVSVSELRQKGITAQMRLRIVLLVLVFVLGFSTVFVALGATITVVGKALAEYYVYFSFIAGLIIIRMGLHFLGFRLALLYKEFHLETQKKKVGFPAAYLMGLAFAFGWTPCVGPVLTSVLFIAGTEETLYHGAALLAVYSLGIGLPFILAAVFVSAFLTQLQKFKSQGRRVEIIVGVLLIIMGIVIAFGGMTYIAEWMLELFPDFQTLG